MGSVSMHFYYFNSINTFNVSNVNSKHHNTFEKRNMMYILMVKLINLKIIVKKNIKNVKYIF